MNRIDVRDITKSFKVDAAEKRSALAHLTRSRAASDRRLVLKGISFRVAAGEIVGIVGQNGCGKSTLLRILAGVMDADGGTVSIEGTVVPLIHLETGVKDRLSVEENVRILCTLLGASADIEDIVHFAELDAFSHAPWYQLSDGMRQRIIFSTAVHANPDVLLLDEVFAVGDEQFRKKGISHIEALAHRGGTVLMVGHQLSVLEAHCDRIMWIEDGRMRQEGESEAVLAAYRNHAG